MTKDQEELLRKYVMAVVNAPHALHLTSDLDPVVFWKRHVMDAVSLLDSIPPHFIKKTMKAIDIGSGNGIPGIPMAILRPDWNVDLLDSDSKKCGFIDMICNILILKNTRVINHRAENVDSVGARNSYDIVTTRALGKLAVALELGAAFVKIGGVQIVPHGTSWKAESEMTMKAANLVGMTFETAIPYDLGSGEFSYLIYRKTAETPAVYPRSVGIPSKRPLK